MQLSRNGLYRNHGDKQLIECLPQHAMYQWDEGVDSVVVTVVESRRRFEQSSYEYDLRLKPEEIIRCLLVVPSEDLRTGVIRALSCGAWQVDSAVLAEKLGGLMSAIVDRCTRMDTVKA